MAAEDVRIICSIGRVREDACSSLSSGLSRGFLFHEHSKMEAFSIVVDSSTPLVQLLVPYNSTVLGDSRLPVPCSLLSKVVAILTFRDDAEVVPSIVEAIAAFVVSLYAGSRWRQSQKKTMEPNFCPLAFDTNSSESVARSGYSPSVLGQIVEVERVYSRVGFDRAITGVERQPTAIMRVHPNLTFGAVPGVLVALPGLFVGAVCGG